MTPRAFVDALCALSFENAFNPYHDCCAVHDRRDAPRQRATLLRTILEAAVAVEIDAIWIGRDLGYRGGRRTGLALTDDVHIQSHAQRWQIDAQRPTVGKAVSERTAAVIWGVLNSIAAPIFLWNVFPLHPHEPDDPFSNRTHNANERKAGEELLFELILLLRPSRLIAIGNDAADVAARLDPAVDICKVRHPSYGGHRDFVRQTGELYPERVATLL